MDIGQISKARRFAKFLGSFLEERFRKTAIVLRNLAFARVLQKLKFPSLCQQRSRAKINAFKTLPDVIGT